MAAEIIAGEEESLAASAIELSNPDLQVAITGNLPKLSGLWFKTDRTANLEVKWQSN